MEQFCNLKLKPEVIYQINEDGMMIYVSQEGMVHAINTTAADVVLFIEEGTDSIKALVERFAEKYTGVEKETLHKDIEEIIKTLYELEIIEEV